MDGARGLRRRARSRLGQLLFPGPCCLCDGELPDPLESPVCAPCRSELQALRDPACPRCGLFYAPGVAPALCGGCRAKAPAFRLGVSAAPYEGPFRRAILALKFQRREQLAPLLAAPAAEAYLRVRDRTNGGAGEDDAGGGGPPPAAVVPIPLPFWRRRRRGFNQAESLARAVAGTLGLPLALGTLRKKHRPAQTSLPPSARAANARGAFRARRLPERLVGRPLLLVDDVFTTGATVAAAVRCLSRAGAGPLDVLTAARAPAAGAAAKPRDRAPVAR